MARWSDEKREVVRARLMEVACARFERDGYEQTTMRQIAQDAGIATGTIFNYFADKQALLFEALFEALEEVKRDCLASLPPFEGDLNPQFEHIAMCFYGYYAQRPALSRSLLKEGMFARGEHASRFEAQVHEVVMALMPALMQLKASGRLWPWVEPRVVLLAFVSHYYMVLLMELKAEQHQLERQRQLIGALNRQLWAGICAPDTSSPEPTELGR